MTRTLSTHEMSLMLQMALFFALHCLPFLVSANKALILTAKTNTVYCFTYFLFSYESLFFLFRLQKTGLQFLLVAEHFHEIVGKYFKTNTLT